MATRARFSAHEVTVVLGTAHGHERVAARDLALRAAAAVLAVPLDALGLDHDPTGRPVLRGADLPLHVSLSHGRHAVAVALTALAPLGVDLEVVRPLAAGALAARYFAADEADWVAGQPSDDESTRAFLWLWTHKEAIGKARGLGLRDGGLRRRIPWLAGALDMQPSARMAQVSAGSELTVAAPDLPSGLVLAVASESRSAVGALVRVHVEQCLDRGCGEPGAEPDDTGHGGALRLLADHVATVSGSAAARSSAGSRTSLPLVVRGKADST